MAYSREVRLGIVLYGGVSLAIYENGVAQELFHAVHGDGVYGLLKDLIDSDINVDIISGTSAGGVNGIYLAYAFANGKDFTKMSNLWREKGDIDKLLRRQNDPETKSLLDSRGYYQPELEEAFRSLPSHKPSENSKSTTMEELDLFVTGTDIHGNLYTVYDDQGHVIDVKDHRSVFRLSLRGSRKNEFQPEYIPELATLARITSCFPVAFEPVEAAPEAQPNLARWGHLRDIKIFLDGGILDNKPFSYTIDAIFGRMADRPVRRFLFYVEPDPEKFTAPSNPEAPNISKAAIDSLINIPGYESIAEDLASIGRLNGRIATMNALAECAKPKPDATLDSIETASVVPDENDCVYVSSRLIQLRDRAVEGILNTEGRREHFEKKEVRRAGRLLVESFMHWQGYGGSKTEALRLFDVYFRLRRLFHVTYAIHGSVEGLHPGEQHDEYQRLWRSVNHHIQALEILQWALEWYVDHVEIDWKSLDARFRTAEGDDSDVSDEDYIAIANEKWGQVERGLRLLLDSSVVAYPEREDEAALTSFYTNLKDRAKQLAAKVQTEQITVAGGNLLEESDRAAKEAMKRESGHQSLNRAIASFCSFLEIDRQIFPLQLTSGTHTLDAIHVVRLSPSDATRAHSARSLRDKVCGKALGAFGGFFKKPWRSNDIMWGRLDAVCQLVECMLTKAGTNRIAFEEPDMAVRLAAIFPQTPDAQRQKLAQDLSNLHALSDKAFDAVVTNLVQSAQEEIIAEEWKNVVRDALEQEREWSNYRAVGRKDAQPPYDSGGLVWTDAKSTPDRLIVATAAAALAADKVPNFGDCKVAGRHFADEIPRPVLMELGARAAMRLEKSFTAGAPRFARVPIIHGTLFNWILPALYGWSSFHKRAPEWRVASSAAVLSSSLAVFLAALLLWRLDVAVPSKIAAAFLAGSLAIVATWIFAFRPPMRTRARIVLGVILSVFWLSVILGSVAIVWPAVAGLVR